MIDKIFHLIICIVLSISWMPLAHSSCLSDLHSVSCYSSYEELRNYVYENRILFPSIDIQELIENNQRHIILDLSLLVAAENNDPYKLCSAIALGASLASNAYRALKIAVGRGNTPIVQHILSHYTIPQEMLWEVSCQAIRFNRILILHLLLNAGSPLFNQNESLMAFANVQEKPRIVRFLVARYITNGEPYTRESLLQISLQALRSNQLHILRLSLDTGSLLSDDNDLLLSESARLGNVDAVQLFLTLYHIHENMLWATSCEAIQGNQLPVLQLLLDAGSPLYDENESLLYAAVEDKHVEIVQYLLDRSRINGNASYTKEDLWECSCEAILANQLEILKLLLEAGSPLFNENESLLTVAVENHKAEIVQYLLTRSKLDNNTPYTVNEIENLLNYLDYGLEQSSQQVKDIFSQLLAYRPTPAHAIFSLSHINKA